MDMEFWQFAMLNEKGQNDVLKKMSKEANNRINTLRKNGVDYYIMDKVNTERKLDKDNIFFTPKKGLFRSKKYKNENDRKTLFNKLEYFLNARSSTLKGLEEIAKERYDTFADMGYIDKSKVSFEVWSDFLKSKPFGTKGIKGDSSQVMENAMRILELGISPQQVAEEFKDYQDGFTTLDKIQEKYNIAPWLEENR